jgi:hypothetical protein
MQQYNKTILTFLGTVLTNLVANLSDGSTVAPHTASDWVRLFVTSAVATGVVYGTRNKLTIDQIDKALQGVEVTVPELRTAIDRFISNYNQPPETPPASA